MRFHDIAIGAAAIGGVGFIGHKVKDYLRQREFDAIREQSKRMNTWSDPRIASAIEELKSMDFEKLREESLRIGRRKYQSLNSELRKLSDQYYTL